jgi:hypothetical protein
MTVGAYFRLLEASVNVLHILSESAVDVVVLVYLMLSNNQPQMCLMPVFLNRRA